MNRLRKLFFTRTNAFLLSASFFFTLFLGYAIQAHTKWNTLWSGFGLGVVSFAIFVEIVRWYVKR